MAGRVLVLSLLRLGDALVHAPALAALAAQGHEVHVLLQRAGAPAAGLLGQRFTVHVLPVDYLGLDPDGQVAAAIAPLRALRFDAVHNLTHKRYAAELAERIAPGKVRGLAMRGGQPAFSSPWLGYLNEWGSAAPLSVLHYADVYCQAVGSPWVSPGLVAGPAAQQAWRARRASAGIPDGAPTYLLQLFTSEGKKTYPLARWAEVVARLAALAPGARGVALASPAEAAQVEAFCAGTGGRVAPWVCSLEEALAALAEAPLVTGDTSLVHVAALRGAPTVLVSSGSSAFRELGPYGEGHVVLQARVPCAPCPHDDGCLLRAAGGGYPCTEAVPAADVAGAVAALLAGGPPPAPSSPLATVFRSRVDAHGLVDYEPVHGASAADACAAVLRAYLLKGLTVHRAGATHPPGAPRAAAPPTGDQRRALATMAAVLEALSLRAQGKEAGHLEAALAEADDGFVMALATAGAERLRDPSPQVRKDARREFDRLGARVRAALAD